MQKHGRKLTIYESLNFFIFTSFPKEESSLRKNLNY